MTGKNDLDAEAEAEVERMIEAAIGGMTPHELLIKTSLAEAADVEGRKAAIQKNRERALKLLAEIDKTLG